MNIKNGNTYFNLTNSTGDQSLKDPFIIYNSVDTDTPYYLYHESTIDGGIHLNKSSNLAFWNTGDSSYILSKSGELWEEKDISNPTLIYDTDRWYMFYCARKNNCKSIIKYATSTDGETWTKQDNQIESISWTDRISPDDIIKIGDTYYMSFHGYVNNTTPSNYGYITNDYGEYWVFGILSSSSLTSGWTDLLSDYYKPFGENNYDYKMVGDQGLFFVKSGVDVGNFYYLSNGNTDEEHNGITLLSNPTTGNNVYESLTVSLDLSRYSDV